MVDNEDYNGIIWWNEVSFYVGINLDLLNIFFFCYCRFRRYRFVAMNVPTYETSVVSDVPTIYKPIRQLESIYQRCS